MAALIDALIRIMESVFARIMESVEIEIAIGLILVCWVTNNLMKAIANRDIFVPPSLVGRTKWAHITLFPFWLIFTILEKLITHKTREWMLPLLPYIFGHLYFLSFAEATREGKADAIVSALFHATVAVGVYELWTHWGVRRAKEVGKAVTAKLKKEVNGDENPV